MIAIDGVIDGIKVFSALCDYHYSDISIWVVSYLSFLSRDGLRNANIGTNSDFVEMTTTGAYGACVSHKVYLRDYDSGVPMVVGDARSSWRCICFVVICAVSVKVYLANYHSPLCWSTNDAVKAYYQSLKPNNKNHPSSHIRNDPIVIKSVIR